MLGRSDLRDSPLRTALDQCLVTLRVEGAAPTTIETYRSVQASYLCAGRPPVRRPTLADFTRLQVCGYVVHLMGEHVRFAHHHNVRAGVTRAVMRRLAASASPGGVDVWLQSPDTATPSEHAAS